MGRGRVQEATILFDKGLNTSVTEVGTVPHPVKIENVWLSRDDRDGAIEQMPGYSLFHTFADNDVAIQAIGSSGVKRYSFALYGLGSTKFYRYLVTDPPPGWEVEAPIDQNIATKTGLTDGLNGSILIAGDVDGNANAWVFNGVDTPFLSADTWNAYVPDGLYNISDIGVARPDASDYSTVNDRIYVTAGDADSGPSVQFFYRCDDPSYVDDTTAANSDAADDVELGPDPWRADNADGFYVASDTPHGGLMYEDFTAQTGTPKGKYTCKYWNGSGWQKLSGISDGTTGSSDNLGFTTTDTDPEVTWTIPNNWEKNEVNSQGPFFWVWCAKTAGVIGSAQATCSRVYLLNQRFGEDEAEGVVKHYLSRVDGTSESALSEVLKQTDGTEGIDAGSGGTIKVVIDKDDVDHDDTEYKVYRTYQDGAQPYDTGLRITTDANGDGEVEDNVPDSELGNLPYLHGDVPPPQIMPTVSHFNRIFGITVSYPGEAYDAWDLTRQRLYWSDLANPESFWTEENGSYAEVFPGDQDEATALARDRGGVLVFKKNHLYKLAGRTPDEFYATEITLADPQAKSVGAPSIRAICYTPAGIVFYWNKAVYLYNGAYPRKISRPIDEDLRAIDSKDEEDNVCIGYYAARNQVYLSVPIASSTPDTTYIFDMDISEWSGVMGAGFRQFLPVSIDADTSVAEFANDTGELFLGVDPAATGKVFQLDSGTTFEGVAIDSDFKLSPFFGSSLNKLKTFLYVDVIFEPVADGAISLIYWINGEGGDATTTVITLDKTGYGRHRRRVNIGYKGRDLNLKISNTTTVPGTDYEHDWKVYGLVIGYIEHESYSL